MISVVIATFGDPMWTKVADRAFASVVGCTDIVRVHGLTLASARNQGAQMARGDRLVFLDADDELEPDFISKVHQTEDILQPLTIFRDGTTSCAPYWIAPRDDFLDGNHIVVGAPVDREMFLDSGGFEEFELAEDWALWLKLRSRGATFGKTEATYIVNVKPGGRNAEPENGCLQRIRDRFQWV